MIMEGLATFFTGFIMGYLVRTTIEILELVKRKLSHGELK